MRCQTLSKCLLPSCVQLHKDRCKDARALDLSPKTSSSWGNGWRGVPVMCLSPISVGESSASWSRFLLMDLGLFSPAICLLYPSLVIYVDAICCSMCAVGKRAAGGRLFLDRTLREQPQDRSVQSQRRQPPSRPDSPVLWLAPDM